VPRTTRFASRATAAIFSGTTIADSAALNASAGFDAAAYYTAVYFSGRHPDGYSDYRGAEVVLRREFARPFKRLDRFANAKLSGKRRVDGRRTYYPHSSALTIGIHSRESA
jgi:hypothetical protein